MRDVEESQAHRHGAWSMVHPPARHFETVLTTRRRLSVPSTVILSAVTFPSPGWRISVSKRFKLPPPAASWPQHSSNPTHVPASTWCFDQEFRRGTTQTAPRRRRQNHSNGASLGDSKLGVMVDDRWSTVAGVTVPRKWAVAAADGIRTGQGRESEDFDREIPLGQAPQSRYKYEAGAEAQTETDALRWLGPAPGNWLPDPETLALEAAHGFRLQLDFA
ncbi:hypothetical protein CC78DRAFT_578789 [Lojkania enalia]|uniref:Uncharacterized protein n=1 Tax=Lojkania enalia TaxID=147567 RepID=A0A9P4KGY6_9PLEO|nr:hypothetical protein CC78DRAFT_578789 [Didymosphaeria enalia]